MGGKFGGGGLGGGVLGGWGGVSGAWLKTLLKTWLKTCLLTFLCFIWFLCCRENGSWGGGIKGLNSTGSREDLWWFGNGDLQEVRFGDEGLQEIRSLPVLADLLFFTEDTSLSE